MRRWTCSPLFLSCLAFFACFVVKSSAEESPVSYARDVFPFLEEQCLACHDDGFETSELSLADVPAMIKGGRRGPAVVPGKSDESLMIQYLTGERQPQMPPETSIPLDQVAMLRRWIDEGAKVDASPEELAQQAEARYAAAEAVAAVSTDAPPPVTSLAYAPDGKVMAVAGYREVVLVEPGSGRPLRRLLGPPDQVTAVAFHPDGTLLAAASGLPGRQGEVRIWKTETWNEVRVLRGHADTVLAMAWRPGSKQIATASLDKLILIWNAETGKQVRQIKSHADIVDALAYSPDGKTLASGSVDKTAKVFDAETGLQQASLNGHNGAVLQVAFSPDGQRLATAGADHQIRLWNLENTNNPERGFGHTGPVYALAWRPDSSSLWAGSGGQPSFLSYKRENGQRVVDIPGETMPKDWVYAVAVAPDGQTVAAGGWDGAVTIWNLKDGMRLRLFIPGEEPADVPAQTE